MTTEALFLMLATQLLVTGFTIYFFKQVFRSGDKKKAENK